MVRQALMITFSYVLSSHAFLLSNCPWQDCTVNPGLQRILRASDIFPEEQHRNLAEAHKSLGTFRVSVFQDK